MGYFLLGIFEAIISIGKISIILFAVAFFGYVMYEAVSNSAYYWLIMAFALAVGFVVWKIGKIKK